MRACDVIVIGGGPGGEVAAARAAEAGLETVLVEPALIGGECAFWACMPSKALLRPTELLAEVARVPGAAGAVTGSLDVTATLRRRDEVIHHLDDAPNLGWLDAKGITLLRGRAIVTGERRVEVDGDAIQARRAVVLATGSSTALPPIDGLPEARPWTNREATTAGRLPASLAVLGGGVVGVEMAQAYARLGTEVTLVESEERVLADEEDFACEHVTEGLRESGVAVRTGAQVERAERHAGHVALTLDDGSTVAAEELLVATGRRPNSDALAPLGHEAGEPVDVDEHSRSTAHPWLYAVGDVNGIAPLTHMAKQQAEAAIAHLLGRPLGSQQAANGPRSPRVVFTDPQLAAVGHTTASAREAGLSVRSADTSTSANAAGSFHGRGTTGTARALLDAERGVLVGATLTGPDVAELLHAFTIAVVAAVPLERLRMAAPPFPTRSEIWLRLLARLAG